MTLTLRVDRDAWEANVRDVAARYGDILAVVKGNGYGFGLSALATAAVGLGFQPLAVGTVYELDALPALTEPPVVLTPVLAPDSPPLAAVLTVGSTANVEALARHGHVAPVAVKLASSMRRYGVDPDELSSVVAAVERAQRGIDQFALHLPLAGDAQLTVSHVDAGSLDRLRARHPGRRIVVRLGTALWHGDKSFLALRADVIEVRTVRARERAGYRLVDTPAAGTLVMVGAGTAHGVHPLPDGRSPFHFARRRLALLEPPHMHTSMVFVPAGDPIPAVGDEIDVQQPLTYVRVDRVIDQ